MKRKFREGDLVTVKHIGGCRIIRIEKQPDGSKSYLLKKGSVLFTANDAQMNADA